MVRAVRKGRWRDCGRAMADWARPEIILAVLALYFAIMAVELSVFTPSGHFDDTKVFLNSQYFAWGYDPKNPPLFEWLARAAILLTGPQIETIFALRMVCLFLMYAGLYLVARQLQPEPLLAVGAGLAMLATLHFHWYFFSKYTNTTVAMALMPWALLAFFRLQRHPSAFSYALFGVVCGMGLLTRYHFAIYLTALAAAAITTRKWRVIIVDRRIFISLMVAGLLIAPHVIWFLQHWGDLGPAVRRNIGYDPSAEHFMAVGTALGNLAKAMISIFLFPLGILTIVLLWPSLRPIQVEHPDRGEDILLIRNMLFFALAIMVIFALAGTTRIHPRHLFFFSFFPLWLITRLDGTKLRPFAAPAFVIALGVCLVSATLGFGFKSWKYANRCDRCDKILDFEVYAQAIRAAGFDGGTIIFSSRVPRGALLWEQFPDARVMSSSRRSWSVPKSAKGRKKDCLYVWKDSSDDAELSRLKNGGPLPGVRLPLPAHTVFGSRDGKVSLSGRPGLSLRFALVKGGLGDCH